MSHPCGPLMASCHMLAGIYMAGILFLNAVVGIQLLALFREPHSLAPSAIKVHAHGRMQYFSSMFKTTCLHGLGYIISQVSQDFKLWSCQALVRVFITLLLQKLSSTVSQGIVVSSYDTCKKYILKYTKCWIYTKSTMMASRIPGYQYCFGIKNIWCS